MYPNSTLSTEDNFCFLFICAFLPYEPTLYERSLLYSSDGPVGPRRGTLLCLENLALLEAKAVTGLYFSSGEFHNPRSHLERDLRTNTNKFQYYNILGSYPWTGEEA